MSLYCKGRLKTDLRYGKMLLDGHLFEQMLTLVVEWAMVRGQTPTLEEHQFDDYGVPLGGS